MKRDTKFAIWVTLAVLTLGPVVAVATTLWARFLVESFL